MVATRSDYHRRQAEDCNEVPVDSCDYGFLQTAEMTTREKLTEAEATAVGATPIRVIRDK